MQAALQDPVCSEWETHRFRVALRVNAGMREVRCGRRSRRSRKETGALMWNFVRIDSRVN